MAGIATHYERLGISPGASVEEIRTSYRALARRFHPDARGGAAVPEMADINEAWRVLSDPGRRAMYDASLRRPEPAAARSHGGADDLYRVPSGAFVDDRPARFPWGWVAILVVLGAIFVFTAGALTKDPGRPTTDGLLHAGDCVVIEANGDAAEALCTGPHDGVVSQFVSLDTSCPIETEEHRDKQGMGKVCVTPD